MHHKASCRVWSSFVLVQGWGSASHDIGFPRFISSGLRCRPASTNITGYVCPGASRFVGLPLSIRQGLRHGPASLHTQAEAGPPARSGFPFNFDLASGRVQPPGSRSCFPSSGLPRVRASFDCCTRPPAWTGFQVSVDSTTGPPVVSGFPYIYTMASGVDRLPGISEHT